MQNMEAQSAVLMIQIKLGESKRKSQFISAILAKKRNFTHSLVKEGKRRKGEEGGGGGAGDDDTFKTDQTIFLSYDSLVVFFCVL